jgi:Mrp family chromosome partitioning ATPase
LFAPVAQYSGARPFGSGDERLDGSRSFAVSLDDRGSPTNGREAGQKISDRPDSDSHRDVVMVVCPGREPTAHDVVVNLAAAYAEAGERVLVVTTAGLRSTRPVGVSGADGPMATVVPVPGAIAEEPPYGHPDNPTQPLPVVGSGASMASGGPPTVPTGSVRVQPPPPAAQARSAVTVEEVVAKCRPQRVSGVSMLPLAELLRGPGEVATRGSAVISAARQIADVVLVEAPGMLAMPDAEALVRSVDAVVVVAQSFHTRVGQATRSGELLRRSGAPTLGVVLTDVEVRPKDLREGSRRTDVRSESF